MLRKLSLLLCLPFLLTGCQNARQIETAAIIENVSVSRERGKLCYTFYRLTSDDTPWGISVAADSFADACRLAREKYIPQLSLAKLELLMIEEDVYREVLQNDVEYISTESSFSPVAYVTLCDRRAMEQLRKTNRTQTLMEEQLRLLKSNRPEVCINYLSVFNHYAQNRGEGFTVPYISSDMELKVSEMRIGEEIL